MNFFSFFNKSKETVSAPARRFVSYAENKNSLAKELATRDKVDFSVVLGQLPDIDDVLAGASKSFEVYRQIMTDSQIRACCNSRKAGTLSLLWEIDRGKAKSKQAKLIEDIYSNLDIESINAEILNAPFFGMQPIEIIWGRVGNYIVPTELKAKNPEWFVFDDE